jgi:integrating conjugative element protein (TIGR03749 family)
VIKSNKKLKKHFSIPGLCRVFSVLGFSILSLNTLSSSAWAKPPIPVSELKLSVQDEQALRAAVLPHEVKKAKAIQETKTVAHWVWRENPLSLTLPLNQEKRLTFPEPVQVDVNGQLSTDQLRIINDHQSIYLTALKLFPQETRIYVTLKKSGQIIFLDVNTMDSSEASSIAADHIEITVAAGQKNISAPIVRENSAAIETPLAYENGSSTSADQWVHLVRWAWQQLYAPNYLLSNDSSILRLPMHTQFWVSGLFYSDTVLAHPLASWSQGEDVITAVELRNAYPHRTALDLTHDLCGHWRAAMIYPYDRLEPAGHKPTDDATLFLISDQPFIEALGGCAHVRA